MLARLKSSARARRTQRMQQPRALGPPERRDHGVGQQRQTRRRLKGDETLRRASGVFDLREDQVEPFLSAARREPGFMRGLDAKKERSSIRVMPQIDR